MKQHKVYLAGPITGESWNEANDWRQEVERHFDINYTHQLVGFSPLRHKHYLKNETKIHRSYEETVFSSQRGIFARDFNDVKTADLVFVNLLNTKIISVGTVMEIAWANAFQIPVVLVMEKENNIHEHPMLHEACPFRVDTLHEGIDLVRKILLP
ncbi:MAG: nucleoside 2-deoxyribosyltransferase [Nitrosopumilaceae archaeon]